MTRQKLLAQLTRAGYCAWLEVSPDLELTSASPAWLSQMNIQELPLSLHRMLDNSDMGLLRSLIERPESSFHVEALPFSTPEGEKINWYGGIGLKEESRVSLLLMDVTRRELDKLRYLSDHEMVELALKGIRSAIFDHNLITDVVRYGPYFAEYVGFTENVAEKDFRNFIHPQDREEAYERHLTALEAPGNYYANHYRLIDSQGDYHHYELSGWRLKNEAGKTIRLVGNLINVDQRYRYQQLLERTNNQLFAMLNNGFVSMLLLDLEGKIVMNGDLYCEPLHNTSLGKPITEFLQPAEAKTFETEFNKARRGVFVRKEVSRLSRKGEKKWFDLMYTPVLDKDNAVQNVLLKYVDITYLKQSQWDAVTLARETEILKQAKQNLIANLSHEVRTPLNGLVGAAEILSSQIDDPALQNWIQILKNSARRLSETFDNFTHFSRLEKEIKAVMEAPVNFMACVEACLDEYRPLIRAKKLGFVEQVTLPDTLQLPIEQEAFTLSLSALLSNALKFTDTGAIAVSARCENKHVYFSVKDTGIGIPARDIESIFTPFSQLSEGLARTHEGSGLGLSVASEYIKRLGGNIYVESEPGKGSTFTFSIPL